MSAAIAKFLEPLIRMIVRIVFEEWRRPTVVKPVGGGSELADEVNENVDACLP